MSKEEGRITLDRQQFKSMKTGDSVLYSLDISKPFRIKVANIIGQESIKLHPKLFIWEEVNNQLIIKRVR